MAFSRIVLLLCLCGFFYHNPGWLSPSFWQGNATPSNAADSMPHPRMKGAAAPVYMYSLSYCGPCKLMASQMTQAGIPYVEYEVDLDSSRQNELGQRLRRAGFAGGQIGMPVLFAGQRVFTGMHTIPEIEAAMQ